MENLIKKIYGSQFEDYRKKKVSLPMYLTEGREFFEVTVLGEKFTLVNIITLERLNIAVLKKHAQKYYEFFNENIAYGLQSVTSTQRKSLIENHIPFVSGNEQIFLPFLGSCFSKCFKQQVSKPITKFSPSSQLLALYMVYSTENKRINKSELAKQIGISAMSVTRAVKDLVKIGVLQEEKNGNEVFVFCEMEKKEMFERITPYLNTPVQETIYIEATGFEKIEFLEAGEYSLSKRSMLGYPKYEEYAIDKNSEVIKRMEPRNPDLNLNAKLIKIQKWKYNPLVLEADGKVDPISLIYSFQNENDERIQMSLDEVQGEIDKWQIMKN